MKSIWRCWRGAARTVVVAFVGLSLAAGPAAAPAEAHARVRATMPADGAVVDAPPERVTLVLDAKPATVEGDPLRVYGPTGERVDAGDLQLAMDGETTVLSVGVPPEGARSAGDYQVAYRVVSADSHLIAGRFGFRSRRPMVSGPPDASGLSAPGPDRVVYGRPDHAPWPKAVFAAGVALAALGVGGRRWRRARRARALHRETLSARRRAITAGLGVRAWAD